MIDIDGLVVRRGDTVVLDGFSAWIAEGETVRVAGANGCGKSTLLNVLAGLHRPTAGRVTVAGQPPGDRAVRALRGFLQEPPPLYEHLTVWEQLALIAGLWGLRTGKLLERADALGLADRQDNLVGELSLGQRKKLGFVCATAHDPELLLLDEPFNALDETAERAVRDDLDRRRKDGRTIVLVSHTTAPVTGLLDRTIELTARQDA
ncbi:ABC transporter ATP-binding protein [Streptomyces sp. NBC_00286]|uniref:ABC transporter ATP-binding protein n=1 Tax=Streptomyces sp. NBC_00286 TaxID=2975701 RepID=UPI002E28D9A7|nr:ABC transporter ATP-binding protein [Streptomyces sp. NBC_00286]